MRRTLFTLCMILLTAHMCSAQLMVNYQIQFVDEFFRSKNIGEGLAIYVYQTGTTTQISVYRPYAGRSFLCAQPITQTSTNTPIYGNTDTLIFSSAWMSCKLVVTDGTFTRTIDRCAPDRMYRMMWPSFGRDWLEETQLDDSAGNGDTDKLWSADKTYDEILGKQDSDPQLTAIAALSPSINQAMYWSASDDVSLFTVTPFTRTLTDDANAPDWLTTLGFSSFVQTLIDDANAVDLLATIDPNLAAFATVEPNAYDIPYVVDANTWSSVPSTDFGRARLGDANEAAFKAAVNLEIGVDAQAYDPNLTAIAGLTTAADKLNYWTGAGTAALTDFTAFARTMLDDAAASNVRTTLGLIEDANATSESKTERITVSTGTSSEATATIIYPAGCILKSVTAKVITGVGSGPTQWNCFLTTANGGSDEDTILDGISVTTGTEANMWLPSGSGGGDGTYSSPFTIRVSDTLTIETTDASDSPVVVPGNFVVDVTSTWETYAIP